MSGSIPALRLERVPAPGAQPNRAEMPGTTSTDKGFKTSNDGMGATWVKVPGDPKASVRIEQGYDGVTNVTDIFSGSLPRGGGSDLLATGLKTVGVKSGGQFRFTGIINPETVAAYQGGVAPADSLLGKVGIKALEKMGLEASTVQYELVRGKLALTIGVK